jgi:hypothetical protein
VDAGSCQLCARSRGQLIGRHQFRDALHPGFMSTGPTSCNPHRVALSGSPASDIGLSSRYRKSAFCRGFHPALRDCAEMNPTWFCALLQSFVQLRSSSRRWHRIAPGWRQLDRNSLVDSRGDQQPHPDRAARRWRVFQRYLSRQPVSVSRLFLPDRRYATARLSFRCADAERLRRPSVEWRDPGSHVEFPGLDPSNVPIDERRLLVQSLTPPGHLPVSPGKARNGRHASVSVSGWCVRPNALARSARRSHEYHAGSMACFLLDFRPGAGQKFWRQRRF